MESVVVEPPLYFSDNNVHVWSTSFHPQQQVLACSLINGYVHLLGYTSEDVTLLTKVNNLHKLSVRQCLFNQQGTILASCSEDRRLGFINSEGKIAHQIKKAHYTGINRILFANEHVLISGDDDGAIKVWDLRTTETVFYVKYQNYAITGLCYDEYKTNLFASSLDGTVAIYDLKQGIDSMNKVYAMSDSADEYLHGVELLRDGKYVVCPSSEGSLLIYKRDNFATYVDRIQSQPGSVEAILKIDEGTVLTGSYDGFVRGFSVYPNKMLQLIGQHEEDENFPVQSLSLSSCRNIVASTSHDNSIKFYDVSDFVKARVGCKQEEIGMMEIDAEVKYEERRYVDSEYFDESESSEEEEDRPRKKNNKKVNIGYRESELKKEKHKKFFQDL